MEFTNTSVFIFLAISIFNSLLSLYGIKRILKYFKASIAYLLLGVVFGFNVILPLAYFSTVIYLIALLSMTLISSYLYVVTFAFRRPNVHIRMTELYFITWVVYLITSLVNFAQFNIILSLILSVYGLFISIYSLGSIKNEYTAENIRKRTLPPYLCCFNQSESEITVSSSLVDEKDINKAVAIASTAHFVLMGIYVILGATIAFFTAPQWYFVFQFCSIPLWNLIAHSSLSIYELGGRTPRFPL
eukprot:NODE_49_length_27162_cov_0.380039.p9 type:complete len:245 gc:universal NODE_49_length_27162_cov_0.380039:5845-5111(-)